MTSIAILIPVLNRPHRVQPLVDSIEASGRFIDLHPVFLCSPDDNDEIGAVKNAIIASGSLGSILFEVVDWAPDVGDYARKINHGAELAATDHEWLFMASDDLHFHPGWAERALACHLETHACVIGTSDLGNSEVMRGAHSTHTLVHRDYLDCGLIDEPGGGKLLFEGYDHNFVDAEFIETAKARETWAHASDSIVEHHHPLWRKAVTDATYQKGQRAVARDRALFASRQHLWQDVHAPA